MARHGPDRPGGESSPAPHKTPEEPNLYALAALGLELAAGVGVFTLIGWALDRWLGTAPWLLIVCAGLGLLGGLYNLWKQTRRYL